MDKQTIEEYLVELDNALAIAFPDPHPMNVIVVGGAFLVLTNTISRQTDDVDVIITDLEGMGEASLVYELTKTTRRVRRLIEAIGKSHGLKGSKRMWFNDDCSMFLQDMGPLPPTRLLRTYRKLHIYAPTDVSYILACKLMAGRANKDFDDIAALCTQLHVHTREQAQAIVNRYFPLEEKQNFQELPKTLNKIFGDKS